MKILIAGGGTGGHLMPALALARVAADHGHEVVLVGAARGIEAQILPRHPFRFYLLPMEPLYRNAWWRNVRWPLIAVRAWRAAGRVLNDERPAIVIGTGGYAAGPVVWRAQRARIPTALQEQNAFPGLTTRWLARGARQVHLGFPEAHLRLSPGPHTQVFVFGNPVTPPGRVDALAARAEFGLQAERPTVLVVGGSQGARALNETVGRALHRELLGDMNVLWGTGTKHEPHYAERAVPGRVVVRGFFDPIATAYTAADLVVARAGAMTVAELCAWGKPSILVPLPTAAADHQTFNARAMVSAGASVMLVERELAPEAFSRTVTALAHDRVRLEALARSARSRGHPNAARTIIEKVLELSQVV
ncbi:MAG TPA: undecaprenyldiphospho-muramoylpentapeptide beta-N-acetylglucosaminyltransferase [Gemmatimonadales bacterium]|jgi:UDP-N-acetylglucosamine--N-acetylmuramyl-(pentapeptide) pyrophosphoryl-undecaprenol N-acetylglucosamine transferase|nr:undecaprenyldiphospho-muramoylpentapeptide beta-N-acetylglucosaminyltransferase [Gemmatimonadales bacterium]